MGFAAFVAWMLTATAGAYLLVKWLANGGRGTKVTRFPMLVVIGHPLAAVLGLAIFVLYLITGRGWAAWAAFGALLVVVFQGFVLLTRWQVGRGGRHARDAEQPYPARAMVLHGVVAAATFVLVFLTALRTGRF
ncbi:hypothetical protein [Spirillospora sp. CA-294931]|uniref:hypothetical protein n=1 Tax=Spirillospora sp. CA-294931 TaxID=3240042 RepID=UPI003D89FF4F